MSAPEALRIVVFGVTGALGQELVERLAESDWPIAELVGVASDASAGSDFEFRGEVLDVEHKWPVLTGRDLVFACTPAAVGLEIVREALRAEVPCVDCSGALAGQEEIRPVFLSAALDAEPSTLAGAPLLAMPSSTALAWAPVLEALHAAVGLSRVVGTLVASAAARGRAGVVSLSEESISLFNQSQSPEPGPAGQEVAFDVIPGGGADEARIRRELAGAFGGAFALDVEALQVPTFVGEGASLAIELAAPLEAGALEALLEAREGVELARDGVGSRGLVAVEAGAAEPVGPTLRDATGQERVLVGRLRPDASLAAGRGWRLWLATDPIRLGADHALRLAERRLGLA